MNTDWAPDARDFTKEPVAYLDPKTILDGRRLALHIWTQTPIPPYPYGLVEEVEQQSQEQMGA